jgi:hypothetical protein
MVRELLISGVLWRVCNGRIIFVTRDHWIPGVLHQFAQPIKVNFLIDEENKQWKEDLVHSHTERGTSYSSASRELRSKTRNGIETERFMVR